MLIKYITNQGLSSKGFLITSIVCLSIFIDWKTGRGNERVSWSDFSNKILDLRQGVHRTRRCSRWNVDMVMRMCVLGNLKPGRTRLPSSSLSTCNVAALSLTNNEISVKTAVSNCCEISPPRRGGEGGILTRFKWIRVKCTCNETRHDSRWNWL